MYSPTLGRAQRGAARGVARGAAREMEALALRTLAGCAAFVACVFFAIPAQADEIEPEPMAEPAPIAEPEPEPAPEPASEPEVVSEEVSEPSWIPSIDVGFEVFDYNVDTTVQNLANPPAWEGTQMEAQRQLMFRIGGELMGPAFEDLPGRPRLFVKGGAQIRTFSKDSIFLIGSPGQDVEPESSVIEYNALGNFRGAELPTDFWGQGSDVEATIQDPSWYAALGVAFDVPLGDNLLLQLKPSVVYSVEEIDFAGRLTTVVEICDPCPGEDPNHDIPTRTFLIERGQANESTTDHSVGIGLEVAVVLYRNLRPVRVSLYAESRFLWLVSDSTTTFGDPSVGSFSVMRDDFGIKGGGGLRFSWVGFD